MDESASAGRNERPLHRQFFALIVIGSATAMALGLALKMPTQLEANDISRWCTVWSLLERGTYAIDECPWQTKTQDKVFKPDPFQTVKPGETPTEHYYSSKPPLLPTMIAGLLYPIRKATGVPLDFTANQGRNPRWVPKEAPDRPSKVEYVMETPKEPVKWPVFVLYFKPMVVLLNVVPLFIFLVLYTRLLDRYVPENDWAWFVSLFAAAWGTFLLVFDLTLNNHTIAAYSGFFAIYALLRIWNDGERSPLYFAVAGFFGAFCACNELPSALFGLVLFGMLLYRFPRETLLYFAPAAALPCAAFLSTQWLAMGKLKPAYEEFGTKSYQYYGSYWNTPLEFDWLNNHPESYPVYFFHMTFGHHGVFSLSPIFLFSLYAIYLHLAGRDRRLSAMAWLTGFLTVAMLAFYTWNPKARNYGGSTQGLRWLFWLIPFWLVMLPTGLEPGQTRKGFRWLTLAALCLSVFSVGYALRTPWSHPWIVDAMEHLGLYTLQR